LGITDTLISKSFSKRFHEILTSKETMYLTGDLEGVNRRYTKWQQVKVPLRRNAEIIEVLSFLFFYSDRERATVWWGQGALP
jgi:hypothetical protein